MEQKAQLKDLLNYEPEQYLSKGEINLIKYHFRDNEKLLKILRKLFLASVADPELPIEEMENDIWLVGRDYAQIPNDEVKSIVVARQEAIKFILGGMIKLKILANAKEETETEKADRRKKDSTK